MGYQKRKRANKYEEKLKIDGTFEDAIKALLGVHPKQQNMTYLELVNYYSNLDKGDFNLDIKNLSYPESDHLLNSRGFSFLLITGESNVGINITFFQANGNKYQELVMPDPITHKFIDEPFRLRLIPCQIKIDLHKDIPSEKPAYAKVSFEFL